MTSIGYRNMGSIAVGDMVYGDDGALHPVLGVFPQGVKDVYEVVFSDGSSTECCSEHLWTYQTKEDREGGVFRTESLAEIMKTTPHDLHECSIPMAEPLEMKSSPTSEHPYLYGLEVGGEVLSFSSIPNEYIFNSKKVRTLLLSGILESRGVVYKDVISIMVESEILAKDIQFLVHSLGGICSIGGMVNLFILNIELRNDNSTLMSNHSLMIRKDKANPQRFIQSIKYVGEKECQCISIDSPNKLYLTDNLIVTHNTTMAINKINSEPHNKFVYITPYLDEIKRVKKETSGSNKMHEPTFKKGSKHNDLHRLLGEGKNICSTHALFQKANDITRQALEANNYILILDEVMDVVGELQDFTSDDLATLLREELAHVEDDFLIWNPDKSDYDGRYNDVKTMADNRNLVVVGDKILLWNFPVDIFGYFKEVYVMTYMFNAQIQKYYYDFFEIKYKMYQVVNAEVVEYDDTRDNDVREEVSRLINIYEGKLNDIGRDKHAMSVSWYQRDDGTLKKILQGHLYNWFNNINRGVPAKQRLWTTFKDFKSSLHSKGYKNRFISNNVRATNSYRETQVLAYTCNRFMRPMISNFFSKRGIEVDQEAYALSEMLQWIWRSRIREGQSIELYVPSQRMRTLLIQWLQPIENSTTKMTK